MRSRQLPQHGLVVGFGCQNSQIIGARLVLAGQASWFHIAGVLHAQSPGPLVHAADKHIHTARESAPQSMGCAIFTGHEGQVHQLTSAEIGAHSQARRTPFFRVHVGLGDADALVHGQVGLGNDQACHQLGQGCNWQDRVVIFAVEDFLGLLVHHQGHAGVQAQSIRCGMQACHLAKRCADGAGTLAGPELFGIPASFGQGLVSGRGSLGCMLYACRCTLGFLGLVRGHLLVCALFAVLCFGR